MATYTDIETFRTDVWPISEDEIPERFIARGAAIAYNFINSRLSAVFPVPFAATYPPAIVDISDLLTKHFAAAFRLRDNLGVQQDVKGAFETAKEWLTDLEGGGAELLDSNGDLIARSTTLAPSDYTEDFHPVFGIVAETAYGVDKDRLDDETDERK